MQGARASGVGDVTTNARCEIVPKRGFAVRGRGTPQHRMLDMAWLFERLALPW